MPYPVFTANTDQVEKCKALIEKLSFPYQTSMFENPSLQKFYSNLEAMALSKDEPEEVTDYTGNWWSAFSLYNVILVAVFSCKIYLQMMWTFNQMKAIFDKKVTGI